MSTKNMMVLNKKLLYFLCLLLLSCSSKAPELKVSGYMHYMEDSEHPYNRKITAGAQLYTIQLATPEYVVLKEFTDNPKGIDSALFKQRLDEVKGYMFFLIKIEDKVPNTSVAQNMIAKSQAEQMVLYYHNEAIDDIALNIGSATQKPATYLFENNYSLVNYNTIVVGFELPKAEQEIQLVFNDRYNDNAFIKAKYSQSELAGLPRLIL